MSARAAGPSSWCITWMLRVIRLRQPIPAQEMSREWDSRDVGGYHSPCKSTISSRFLYGHTHVRNIMKWNGTPQKAEQGYTLFNVDNSGHFGSKTQSLFYFEYSPQELTVREYTTADRWETGTWTGQTWTSAVAKT